MSRVAVSHAAWFVLYPCVLALLLFALPARLAGLTADGASASLLRPAGGAYAVVLFGLEVIVLCWYVANTLLMASRRWSDWVALYVSIGGMTWMALALPWLDALTAADPRWAIPVAAAQWLGAAMPALFLLFFPDGRFVPRRAAILVGIWPVTWALTAALTPGSFGLLTMPAARLFVWMAWITASLGAPLYRFRSASPTVRQQTKWVVLADFAIFGGILLVLPARFISDADLPFLLRAPVTLPLFIASLGALAFGFTMGILKYRLWDIDILINRTVVYGIVTASLAAAFAGSSAVAQRSLETLTGERSDFVNTALGLGLLLAFVPLRKRIQPIVDRLLPARGLLTLLFTDIVNSTTRVVEMGDERWRQLLEAYRANVRRELARFGGREMDTAGDGFFATFDRTVQGLRCAVALRESLRELGLDSRIGLHAGECELRGERVSGVNVVVAARVMAVAAANEIVVSDPVRELAVGSSFRFTERGTHALKGVPGEWRLQQVDGSAR